jgi:UDP-glucuronate 4-epimerase
MKILITGTAGFIGMHLAIELASLGHQVVGLDNINSYYDTNLKYGRLQNQGIQRADILYNKLIQGNSGIQFIELDLQDAGNLQALFSKNQFDAVVNLAAQAGVRYSIANPKDYIDSNIVGFFNLLEACRNFPVKHLVYASSSSVYGNSIKVPFNETDPTDEPISFYAATKKTNEVMAHTYAHLYGIKTTGLRFFTVYGPWGRPDMAMFLFTKAILKEEPLKVFNEGNLYRDFTYISDIINGIVAVLNNTASSTSVSQILNIGNGEPVNLLDFIKEIELQLNKKAIRQNLPIQDGDVITTFANTENLRIMYDYTPKVAIKEGISKFINWYKLYYNLEK